jgi:CIC family chloride channel protein
MERTASSRAGGGPLPARDARELRAVFFLFSLAAAIGVLGGVAAIAFQELTTVARRLLMGGGHGDALIDIARRLDPWQALVTPALGAAVASLLLHVVFRVRGSYGVADLMEIVSLRKGGVDAPATGARSLSLAAVIGSGGSTGREGPIIQIGAALATTTGRVARLRPRELSVLVACGAAAGMAGAYNAPIGAAMFVMEIVLGSFVMEQFAPVIVASVTSTLTVRALAGGSFPLYEVPEAIASAGLWEAVPIFVLGLLAAVVGGAFLRLMALVEDALHRTRLPAWALPVVGGLAVGAIGLWPPLRAAWGNGYDAVNLILHGEARALSVGTALSPLLFLPLLLLAKALATAFTTGAGVGGGVFTPTLFVGATLGATFGGLVNAVAPGAGLDPGLFALVGMGSVLAATTHAPLMSILILFELTSNPLLIAPLMLGAITATLFARWMNADSLYTARLRRRGVRLPDGVEEAALLRTYAKDLLRTDAEVLPATAPLEKILDRFLNTRRDALYVVGDGGRYVGVARIHDVKAVFDAAPEGGTIIALDVAVPVRSIAEDESVGAALARFDDGELDEVPVVASASDPRFVGTVSRRDILAMLRHEVLEEAARPVRVGRGRGGAYLDLPEGLRVGEIPAPADALGKPADPSAWLATRGALPLVVLRPDGAGSRRPLPLATTPLRLGDSVVVLSPTKS